jgi:hypothetical protein
VSNSARAEVAAFGKEANGQRSQTGSPLASARSTDKGAGSQVAAALSCPQMKAQATHSHRKLSGSSVAVNLRRVKRLAGIARIISGRVHACHC